MLPILLLNTFKQQILPRQLGKWQSFKCRSSSISMMHGKYYSCCKGTTTCPVPNVVSPPYDQPAITGITVPELIWERISKHEKLDAFSCAVSGRKYTHGQMYKASRSFATALQQSGLKRGDVVCLALPNIPEYPIAALGIWEAGLVTSPLNPIYTLDEYKDLIKMSSAKAVVTIPQLLPLVQGAKGSCPQLKSIIVIGDAQEGCHSFFEMIKVEEKSSEFLKGSQVDTTQEIASIPFSSGTTGLPKGVMLTISNLTSNIVQGLHPEYAIEPPYDGKHQARYLGILPFFHAYGNTCVMLVGLYIGAHVLCLPKFSPPLFIKAFKEFQPTLCHFVTPLVMFTVMCPDITAEDMKHLRGVAVGATPCGKTLIDKLLAKSPKNLIFQEGYGMTECNAVSHITMPRSKNAKIGTIGTLIPGTSAKIVDLDSGVPLGPGEKGELCLRGPQIMKGYVNNPTATAETIDPEGWLRTGDIAYYDNDFDFFIVERLKSLIKVKGLQVAPSELENILRNHPGVADAAVIGVPDDRSGELPRAYIVKADDNLTEESVQKLLENKVAKHKQLAGGVEFVAIIPKASSGKILHRMLLQDYLKKHGK